MRDVLLPLARDPLPPRVEAGDERGSVMSWSSDLGTQ